MVDCKCLLNFFHHTRVFSEPTPLRNALTGSKCPHLCARLNRFYTTQIGYDQQPDIHQCVRGTLHM